jgi:hypothetical protein
MITAGICDQQNGELGVSLHSSNPDPVMSALGQKQTLGHVRTMSALPPKADIAKAKVRGRYRLFLWFYREQTTAHKRLFAEGPPSGAFWLSQCCKQPSFFKNKSSSAGIPPRALTTKATMTFG